MKMTNIEQYVDALHQFHHEIENEPTNLSVTEKISQFLDENRECVTQNIEIATELDAIAAVVKTNSSGNPLIQKIRACVQQILPIEAQTRNHSLELLRSKGDIRQIAEWIELMDIPVDELPLSVEEQFAILRIKVNNPSRSPSLGAESLGETIQEILRLNKELNDSEKKIVISLAKNCAKSDWRTAFHIQNFSIQEQDALVEIAKLCANQVGSRTAEHIQNFGIQEQEALVEIAKLCVNQVGQDIAEHIQNFGIQEQDALVKIAKLCAKKQGMNTACCIKNFGIQEQDALVEIAKLCAQEDGEGTAYYIKNFGIHKEAELVEVAKLCAQQSGGGIAEYIQNFGIQEQRDLIEIAKLCAKNNAWKTAEHINNFDIQEQNALVEIAKLCAQQSGGGTAEYIQNFGIQEQRDLSEIAKFCVNQNSSAIAGKIKNFGIENQAVLVEIAMICAKQNAEETAIYIKNFGIENQAVLVEIAMICAKSNGQITAQHIQNFGIQNAQHRFSIFIECVKQSEAVFRFAKNLGPFPKSFQDVFETIEVLENSDGSDQRRSLLIKALHDTIQELKCAKVHKDELQALCQKISTLDPYQQRSQAYWFIRCLCLMTTLDQNALEWTIEKGFLNDLSALHDPQLRQQLTGGLFELAESEESRNRWSQFVSQKSLRKGMRLLSIPLFGLESKGVRQDDTQKALQSVLKPRIMKDALKIQLLLHTTYLLASNPALDHEQVASAFSKVFLKAETETQIKDNLIAAKGLLQLKETDWATSEKELGALFRRCFEKTIPLEGFQGNVSEMYDKFFANSRHPEGLITYAAGLKNLRQPELLKCLGRFVVSVFDGTFKAQRYDSAQNLHLAEIYKSRPDLKEKWSQSSEMRFENVSRKGSPQEEVFDAKDWLYSNLCRFGHLGQEDVSIVRAYLDASSDESRKSIQKSLTDEIRKCSDGKKKVDLDQDPRVLNLKIQLRCIDLAKAGNERSLALLEKEFKAIKQSLEAKGVRAEFVNDVDAILKAIAQPKAPSEETFQAVITDNPLDLLYVGMDVQGSCQRLDGKANFNKGLLGYLMDGKNQVLAIKDAKGKIVARAMLRLMWDGEQPVLYRERFYPATISRKEQDAMNQAVTQLAKALNVVITSGVGGESYGKPLHSLGGPAPWEYSDANGGVQRNGIYTIENAKVLEA